MPLYINSHIIPRHIRKNTNKRDAPAPLTSDGLVMDEVSTGIVPIHNRKINTPATQPNKAVPKNIAPLPFLPCAKALSAGYRKNGSAIYAPSWSKNKLLASNTGLISEI